MAAEDLELRELIGWVRITAKACGWDVTAGENAANSNAVGPTFILDDGSRTIAVKLKTTAAFTSTENAKRGGLSKTQAEARDRWSGEWHTWSPGSLRAAFCVLAAGSRCQIGPSARTDAESAR